MSWIWIPIGLLVVGLLFGRYFLRQKARRAAAPRDGGRQFEPRMLGKMLAGGAPPKSENQALPPPESLPVDEQTLAALRERLQTAGIAEAPQLQPLFHSAGGTVWQLTIPGKRAIPLWNDLRALAAETGYWPVVLGDASQAERIYEVLALTSVAADSASALASGETPPGLQMPAWFESQRQKFFGEEGEFGPEEIEGTWPKGQSGSMTFTVPTDILSGKPLPEVLVALVPATEGWQVPAFLQWGGWNDCPSPAEQTAVLRYWSERYGAELVCLSADVLEMQIARPPTTREEAMELAWQQFAYCSDIVTQGTETVASLAATLLQSKNWYFWWD